MFKKTKARKESTDFPKPQEKISLLKKFKLWRKKRKQLAEEKKLRKAILKHTIENDYFDDSDPNPNCKPYVLPQVNEDLVEKGGIIYINSKNKELIPRDPEGYWKTHKINMIDISKYKVVAKTK